MYIAFRTIIHGRAVNGEGLFSRFRQEHLKHADSGKDLSTPLHVLEHKRSIEWYGDECDPCAICCGSLYILDDSFGGLKKAKSS